MEEEPLINYDYFGLLGLLGGLALLSGSGSHANGATPPASKASPLPYSQVVLNDLPVAYYRLDETNNSIVDLSGRSNNGILLGNVQRGATGLIYGDMDTATAFNWQGAGQIPGKSYLDFAGKGFSLEAWIKAAAVPDGRILDKSNFRTGTGYKLGVSHGTLYFGGTTEIQISYPWVANSIYHIVAESDGNGQGKIFINGKAVVSGAVVDNTDYNGPLLMGVDANDTQRFNGILDEVAIYNQPLTGIQVQKHYAAGSVPAPGAFWVAVIGTVPGVFVLSRCRRKKTAGD